MVESDRIKVISEQSATGFYELVICQVTQADAGEYTCKALNRFGEAMSTAKVTVTSITPYLHFTIFISSKFIINR